MKPLFILFMIILNSLTLHAQDEFEMKEGDTTYVMKKYYLVLLKANADKEKLDSAAVAEIQEAHLDNIGRLHKLGKIAMAGPMGEDGELRGIFIMDCESIEEARELCETDPAISKKRLLYEVHSWWAAKGSKLP